MRPSGIIALGGSMHVHADARAPLPRGRGQDSCGASSTRVARCGACAWARSCSRSPRAATSTSARSPRWAGSASRRSRTIRCSAASRHRSSPSAGTSTRAAFRRPPISSRARATACRRFAPAGRPGRRSSTPRSTPTMAPHWVRGRGQGAPRAGRGLDRERLQADTERYLPAYPSFCHTLTENFVLIERAPPRRRTHGRTQNGGARAPPSRTRFRAAPRGEGLVKGAMGWYWGVPARWRECGGGLQRARRILPWSNS